MSIKLILKSSQAKTVSTACEFFSRIKIGQFKEIVWHTLSWKLPSEDYCDTRDLAEHYLFQARYHIYPDLHGVGHSYGIGKFEEADKAFDVYQVIRQHFGDPRSPFSYYPLPLSEKRKNGEGKEEIILTLSDEQAKIVAKACEFYARIRIGQFARVIDITLDNNIPVEEYCERRKLAESFLLETRKHIYPELGNNIGSSYAVRKFEDTSDAYDVQQVIDHFFGNPQIPFSPNPLPKIERVEEEEKKKEK